MKIAFLILPIVLVISIVGIFMTKPTIKQIHSGSSRTASIVPTASIQPTDNPDTVTSTNYCLPSAISAVLSLDPGAGNIYGTMTIKNISQTACTILGGNYVTVTYDTLKVKNIQIVHLGQPETTSFSLEPGQIVYSQLHYPNGPQCSGQPITTPVQFSYQISPSASVTFADDSQKTSQMVPTCTKVAEITTIQLWNVSTQPITQ